MLVVTPWYPTPEDAVGGIFVREHVQSAASCARPVVVHLRRSSAPAPVRVTSGEDNGVLVLRVDGLLHRSGALLSAAAVIPVLGHLRRRGLRPAMVHGHVFTSGVLAALLAAVLRVPLVVSEHASSFLPAAQDHLSPAQRGFVRWLLGRAARVLAVSASLRQQLAEIAPGAAIDVLPNAVDEALFHPAAEPRRPGPPRLLVVARLDPGKRVADALDTMARIRANGVPAELDVVGDGPLRSVLEADAAGRGLAPAVRWRGTCDRAAVADLMRGADLLLVPSAFETFGVVGAEALLCGTRVVATRCGGPEGWLTPGRGRLVPVGDTAAAARAVLELLREPPDRAAIAASAAGEFGRRAVGEALCRVYAETIGD